MNTISVTVRDRQGSVFEGEALSLSAYNKKGRFDILQNHANFISIIYNRLSITRPDGIRQEFPVKSGVMQIIKNKVLIYLGVK